MTVRVTPIEAVCLASIEAGPMGSRSRTSSPDRARCRLETPQCFRKP